MNDLSDLKARFAFPSRARRTPWKLYCAQAGRRYVCGRPIAWKKPERAVARHPTFP
jgi:hypothetical protein